MTQNSRCKLHTLLTKGRNVLTFTRTVPEDFIKEGYRFAGPEFGGITLQSFLLKPAKDHP